MSWIIHLMWPQLPRSISYNLPMLHQKHPSPCREASVYTTYPPSPDGKARIGAEVSRPQRNPLQIFYNSQPIPENFGLLTHF
ncbi:UNVERIFIED_CONTAM: hypothetical protein Slati_1307700 [Sesamum latifolium]|uniref:Uncharacterized protein n=1 Tax=Sesamum latifolium TaxID=2727402 RepID=A0AAW2XM34_9LAMI